MNVVGRPALLSTAAASACSAVKRPDWASATSKSLSQLVVRGLSVRYQDIADENRLRTSLTGLSAACPGKISEP